MEKVATWRTLNSYDGYLCWRCVFSFPIMCCNMAGSKNSNKCVWTSEEPKMFLDFIHKTYQNISPTPNHQPWCNCLSCALPGEQVILFPVCNLFFFYILLCPACCSMLHFFSGFLLQIFKRFASHWDRNQVIESYKWFWSYSFNVEKLHSAAVTLLQA